MKKDTRKYGISSKRGRQPTNLDPFKPEEALKEPSLCTTCKTVYQQQHWSLNQKEYRKLKNDSLYEPQMNYNPTDEDSGSSRKSEIKKERGRPAGSGVPIGGPRQSRVVGGIGGISLKEIQSCLIEMDKIKENVYCRRLSLRLGLSARNS